MSDNDIAGTVCGIVMASAACFLSTGTLAWLLPRLGGLLFAVPLSLASGSKHLGTKLLSVGLLLVPEELAPHPLLAACNRAAAGAATLPDEPLVAIVADPATRARHVRWAASGPRLRGAPDPAYLTAAEKIAEAHSLDEALAWLDPRERIHAAGHQAMSKFLARLPIVNSAGAGSPPRPVTENLDPSRELEQMRSPAA